MSKTKTSTPSITTTENIKTFGKIDLPINPTSSPHIPNKASEFIDHDNILRDISIGIKDNLPVLLIGESGTGKTSAIRYLAKETNNGLRRINLNGGTTADELVGRNMINEKGTYWIDGALTEAMRHGEWIVFDEINAALPEVLFVLQSVLDDDGFLVLTEKDDKELVYKHPNFRIFATCNPPEYAGTKEMNQALLSRFAICIDAQYPVPKTELNIVEYHLGAVIAKSELATKLIDLAGHTRKNKENGSDDYAINTRDILHTLRLAEYMEPTEALNLCFGNKLAKDDSKAIQSLGKLHLPMHRKATTLGYKVNNEKEIKVGKKYTLNLDTQRAFYCMVPTDAEADAMAKQDLNTVLNPDNVEPSVKGDEFIIKGIYYKDSDTCTPEERNDLGDKLASIIKFTGGHNKDKSALFIHAPSVLPETKKLIENLYEKAE